MKINTKDVYDISKLCFLRTSFLKFNQWIGGVEHDNSAVYNVYGFFVRGLKIGFEL